VIVADPSPTYYITGLYFKKLRFVIGRINTGTADTAHFHVKGGSSAVKG
jgi:hypothetical protein